MDLINTIYMQLDKMQSKIIVIGNSTTIFSKMMTDFKDKYKVYFRELKMKLRTDEKQSIFEEENQITKIKKT